MAKTVNNEALNGFSDYIRFNYLDLQTTGFLSTLVAANQRKFASVPAGGAVEVAAVYVITAAAGASDIVLDVGTTGADPDDFIDALDLDGLTKAAYNTGDVLTTSGDDGTLFVNNSASALPVYIEVGGTVGSLTAGEWIVAIRVLDPGKIAVN